MIIPIFIPQLGCPGRCLYCNQEGLTGEQGLPEPEAVDDTVRRYLSSRKGVMREAEHEIAFYGGSFTMLPYDAQERLLAAAGRWIGKEGVSHLRLSTRPDGIDDATVERLLRYGVSIVEVGAQSMDPSVLEKAGRRHGPGNTVRAVRLLKQAGLRVGIHLMTGLPGDDERGALSSLQECLWVKADFLRIHPTLVLKDSPLAQLWMKGKYQPWGWGRTLRLLSRMAALCAFHGVPVIRWGLMPGEQCDQSTLAGPLSPSLGEWVSRYLAYRYSLALISRFLAHHRERPASAEAAAYELIVPVQARSLVTGHRQWLLRQVNAAAPLPISGVTVASTVQTGGEPPFHGDWQLACDGRTACRLAQKEFIRRFCVGEYD
ncbi:radical SAM protein [Heliobacterium gestii]|uniref:Radical SAM protein n=1 Tax=Heliomicrobium gestii TaxID=2699 RepID=A0A845LBJ6_HELGE|nr:radical SAM protein [Heliomicrobium gestii]MBM7867047.1 histone acetyltransferase (RNA polymerase elongator complex component) [Heliomicrobium gestii]MZP43538.1 radical SAM protein [Heliomicrobium gestii]